MEHEKILRFSEFEKLIDFLSTVDLVAAFDTVTISRVHSCMYSILCCDYKPIVPEHIVSKVPCCIVFYA